jgi:tether containing UBX domain for GLUT4
VLANFHWEDAADANVRRQSILKPHLREKAQEVKVPVPAAAETRESAGPSAVDDKGKGKEGDGEKKSKGGMPKWLKLGKK